jgi:hypothetical protein
MGFHLESLSNLQESVNVGTEVLLSLPDTATPVRGSVVRVEPEENRCIIQIMGMYNMF